MIPDACRQRTGGGGHTARRSQESFEEGDRRPLRGALVYRNDSRGGRGGCLAGTSAAGQTCTGCWSRSAATPHRPNGVRPAPAWPRFCCRCATRRERRVPLVCRAPLAQSMTSLEPRLRSGDGRRRAIGFSRKLSSAWTRRPAEATFVHSIATVASDACKIAAYLCAGSAAGSAAAVAACHTMGDTVP